MPRRCSSRTPRPAGGAYHVPMALPSDEAMSPTVHYYTIMGRAAEIARTLGSRIGGAEHLFLAMLHDGGWPVSALSPLVDPGRAEEAVRGIMHDPGYSPPSPSRFYQGNRRRATG